MRTTSRSLGFCQVTKINKLVDCKHGGLWFNLSRLYGRIVWMDGNPGMNEMMLDQVGRSSAVRYHADAVGAFEAILEHIC